jgi:hypothetical protein
MRISMGEPWNGSRGDVHGRSLLVFNVLIRISRTTDEMTTRELRDAIAISPVFCSLGSLRGTMFELKLDQTPVYSRGSEEPTDAWYGKSDHQEVEEDVKTCRHVHLDGEVYACLRKLVGVPRVVERGALEDQQEKTGNCVEHNKAYHPIYHALTPGVCEYSEV